MGDETEPWAAAVVWVMIAAGIFTYALPIVVASARNAKHVFGVAVLTVFAGWSGAGWVAALIWAFVSPRMPSGGR